MPDLELIAPESRKHHVEDRGISKCDSPDANSRRLERRGTSTTIPTSANQSSNAIAFLTAMPRLAASVVADAGGAAARMSMAAVARDVLRQPAAAAQRRVGLGTRDKEGTSLLQDRQDMQAGKIHVTAILEALTPDRIAVAVAALNEIEVEARRMERQWSLKRERARYDAERARRQYDAVEPENRLVARSLERNWKARLRRADYIEQEYEAWRREQAVSVSDSDRREVLGLGEDLPRLWHTATTTPAERKQIVRLVINDVVLDQKRRRGYVWIKIVWQTGAVSEHWLQRNVRGYADHADQDKLRRRIVEFNRLQKTDSEIATVLNTEGFRTAHGPPFSGAMVHQLRKRWKIPTVKIKGTRANPPRWSDGSYSVQGAAAAIGITPQVIFDWLRKGRLRGKQVAKGMPWQIALSPEEAAQLRAKVRRTNRFAREAS